MAKAKTNKSEKMTLLKRAIRIGSTVGKQQGWGVFDVNSHGDVGQWAVHTDDEAGLIEDDHEAIRLAREAGIDCDYYGRIRGLHDAADPAWVSGERWHGHFAGSIAEESDGEWCDATGITTASADAFAATGCRGDLIAWVPHDRRHEETVRLITAAPELLAAIEAAVKRSIERQEMGGRGGVLDDDIFLRMTALIHRCK